MNDSILKDSILARVKNYRQLAERCFEQLTEADFHFKNTDVDNSIAVIIQHMAGNMRSRFTDFLTTDGEKEWRKRDEEFAELSLSRKELIQRWNEGWNCFLNAIEQLEPGDWEKTVFIRGESMTVTDAVIRQLAHYPYHIGQIVHISRQIRGDQWISLSIPRGASQQFNQQPGPKDPGRRDNA
jgi:uncharacterized damage-inducible protein DinB